MSTTARLVERIREEYSAMPGLKLTCDQVCRLWGAGHDTCEAALAALLEEGFLHQTGTGKYVALPRPASSSIGVSGEELSTSASLRCPHCGKRNNVGQTQVAAGHLYDATVRCEGCQRIISSAKRSA